MTTERRLDWHGRFDEQSKLFAIRRTDCFKQQIPHRKVMWGRKLYLDQGSEGACTGFGTAHALHETPRRNPNVTEEMAHSLYQQAKRLDQWAGEDYEGSSVLGAMKAAKRRGFISGYRWCLSVEEIAHAVSWHGPVVIGVPWFSGMYNSDQYGVLKVSGEQTGGHCVCLGGVDPAARMFRLDNSWGRDWGKNGSALISWFDIEQLMAQWGEFALPNKVIVRN